MSRDRSRTCCPIGDGAAEVEEPKPGGMVAEVHDEVADLLRCPRPVGICGDAQDVQAAVTDLEREQDIEPPQCHRAVDVEEVAREYVSGLGAQELTPTGVGVPARCRWDAVALEDPADRRGADAVADRRCLVLQP